MTNIEGVLKIKQDGNWVTYGVLPNGGTNGDMLRKQSNQSCDYDWETVTGLPSDLTATVSELNILDGCTLTTTGLNKISGLTTDATHLNYCDGLTSSPQNLIGDYLPWTISYKDLINISSGISHGKTWEVDLSEYLPDDNKCYEVHYQANCIGTGSFAIAVYSTIIQAYAYPAGSSANYAGYGVGIVPVPASHKFTVETIYRTGDSTGKSFYIGARAYREMA